MKKLTRMWLVAVFALLIVAARYNALAQEHITAQDITSQCLILPSEGDGAAFSDGDERTAWSNAKAGANIELTLPSDASAGGVSLSWLEVPEALEIVEYDAAGKELARGNRESIYAYLYNYYQFEQQTVKAIIRLPGAGAQLSELRVYSRGELPDTVMNWAPMEKADLMLVAVHPGDELLYFGGALPYYSQVRGKAVLPVYITGGSDQCRTALKVLWELGLRHYPAFLRLPDGDPASMVEMEALWGKTQALSGLVTHIRKHQPDVVVSHDLEGENGSLAHQLAALTVREAVMQTPVATKFGGSYQEFGTWQVKKLYLHLLETAPVRMNWQVASDKLGGRTPEEAARGLYAQYLTPPHPDGYQEGADSGNTRFGLALSGVAADSAGNDFFENLPGNVPDPAMSQEGEGGADPSGNEAQTPIDVGADSIASDNRELANDTDNQSPPGQPDALNAAEAGREADPRRGMFTLLLFGIPVLLAALTFCISWLRARIRRARNRRRKQEARRREAPHGQNAARRRQPPVRQ